ncbi:L-carnitine dehydrogenase [Cladobotryum mycophilum]|uniref:L-gulonate 3-dehydrogenase n=1 Tax=Cladobotryum mycophilum TaxID=491253 RepID=A0ABR0SDD8_9HYPO
MASNSSPTGTINIAIIGAGTIGLSFAALHLSQAPVLDVQVTIYDPRSDIKEYVENTLPTYLTSTWSSAAGGESPNHGKPALTVEDLFGSGRLLLASSLSAAVEKADIVQEQGPENVDFKQKIWSQIEPLARPDALFWSSTSGIPASVQGAYMKEGSRILIVHPYNPPHIMPLLEIVPHDAVSPDAEGIKRTIEYWKALGRDPVVLKEEITGFVANRLAFALFREAAYLAHRGVASVEEIDRVVEQSLGPRWAVRGPFWSYHAGGGQDQGLRGFFDKIGGTIQACWEDSGKIELGQHQTGSGEEPGWEDYVCDEVDKAYGSLREDDLRSRDEKLRKVLDNTML